MHKKNRGIDPIGWSLQNPFPATVVVGEQYEEVYQLVSNLPAPMPAPLTVTHTGGSDFTVEDPCSGLFLVPGQTCNVTVRFSPSSAGAQQFQLTLHYFNDVVPLPVQTIIAEGSTLLIEGSVTQALPATTLVDTSYPVIFTFQNVGGSPATNLDLESSYPTGFIEESDTCSGTTLAAGASCTVQGSLIPPSPGSYTVAAALNYAESQTPASVSTNTDAIVVDVTGSATTPLPSMTEVGDSFPVEFTYTNNSPIAATGVTITKNYPAGFTQNSDNCSNTLAANASCSIQGTFIPATAGDFTVGVSLAYVEGSNPVPLATSTTADVGALGVTGDVTTPLPATTSIDVSYPVVFTYTNQGSVPATSLVITPTYPAGFTPQSDTCTGSSLTVGANCTVKGELLPATTGNYTVAVSLAYDQSLNPVPLSTETAAIVVDITGTVTTDLPAITSPDDSYPVVFSYENNSAADANGVVITPNYPNGFIETANSCADSTTLEAHSSCSIEGSFTPPSEGDYTVATSLTYAGGVAPIPLETSTTTVAFVLTGEVTIPLPPTTELGESYPVEFTFKNENPLSATNLHLTSDYPADFTETANTCTNTLAANASCVVSGDFIPNSTTAPEQPITVKTTLSYDQGADIVLDTSTEVESQVDISGDVTTSLPSSATASATPLPVSFEFANHGNTPATGLDLVTSYPTEFTQTSNTCIDTLAPDATCVITGDLDISATGNYSVSVTLNTDEVAPVSLSTETLIIAAEVIGLVEQALPGSTAVGNSYPVTFLFTNKGTVDATSVNLDTSAYPPDFNQTSTTCGTTLAAGASCQVKGTLTPTIEGPQTVALTFQYAEGADIPLSTSTTVGMLVLQGFVQQGFPDVAAVNTEYPLIFKYTNPGPDDATGLSITPTPGLNITSDTCDGGTLAAGASCIVEANFTPTQFDAYTVGVTLSYDQGEDIPVNTYTVVGTNLVLAVGEEGFRYTLTGTENRKWVNQSSGLAFVNFNGVAFSPKLQLYVIVGDIRSSSGGTPRGYLQNTVNGQSYNAPPWNPDFLPRNIIWNSDLSQFLAVGSGGGIATSVDGVNWVTQLNPIDSTLRGATWSPQQRQYVVVGDNGTILTSPNGIDWQSQISGVSDRLESVAWSPSLERYVISVNANYVLNSTDGITWTNPGATMPTVMEAVAWSPQLNLFSIVGDATVYGWSSDGQSWSFSQPGLLSITLCVIWSPGRKRFFSGGTGGTLRYSLDGMYYNRPAINTGFRNVLGIAAGALPS